MKIEASSKTKFKISGKTAPSKKEVFKAWVWAKGLNVRTWAGAGHNPCSFSPLSQGAIISVCDVILSVDGKNWYYICYEDKYGFVNAAYVTGVPDIALRFIDHLENFHAFVKSHGDKFEYRFDGNLTTFQKVKNCVKSGKIAGITCVVPCRLAMKELGINPSGFWGKNGSFKHCYNSTIKKYFDRITKGGPIGLTVEQAVDKGALVPGDVCTFEGRTHTFVYSGDGCFVYDGGHAAIKGGKYIGIKVDYSIKNKNCRISEVLRLKG